MRLKFDDIGGLQIADGGEIPLFIHRHKKYKVWCEIKRKSFVPFDLIHNMESKVGINALELFDKYEGDFGLLDERWASKKDRESISNFQMKVISEYVELLLDNKLSNLSDQYREGLLSKITILEEKIEGEVINILRKRYG